MFPHNVYNQNGFQMQDWANYNNYNNNNYRSRRGGRGRGGRSGRGGRGGRGGRRKHKYYWTHGLQGHNGSECQAPMQGHLKEATLENCMGGSTRGVPSLWDSD